MASSCGGEDQAKEMAAELTKTLKEGERVLAPTRRPDGTLRKPIRIRAGYVPQDEVAIYKSKGALLKQEMELLETVPPGYDPEVDVVCKPKSKSAKRNERKKEKRSQASLDKGKSEVPSIDEVDISSVASPPLNSETGDHVPDIDKRIRALKKKLSAMKVLNFRSLIIFSAFLRALLIVYGEWQDTHMEVRYTDVDYLVFSDAAALVVAGKSPYKRSTYRYSPLIAYILAPNSFIHRSWGKFLFSASDLLVGYFIRSILKLRGVPENLSIYSVIVWLFNPFTFTIGTRGNCEPIICAIILWIIICIMRVQIVLIFRFAQDFPFCFFVQTVAFVAFNKVITAQYFVWFFCLLPLILPWSKMKLKWEGIFCILLWIGAQTHWLFWGYMLEFKGKQVFLQLWAASLLFFAANTYVMITIILRHTYSPVFKRLVSSSSRKTK